MSCLLCPSVSFDVIKFNLITRKKYVSAKPQISSNLTCLNVVTLPLFELAIVVSVVSLLCAYGLLRLRHHNHWVMFGNTSWFGIQY